MLRHRLARTAGGRPVTHTGADSVNVPGVPGSVNQVLSVSVMVRAGRCP